jgi:hypothetical protein
VTWTRALANSLGRIYNKDGEKSSNKTCRRDRLHCEHSMLSQVLGKLLMRRHCRSLYRRSLKLSLDWAVHRHLWRGQALYIRSLFEANRNVTDPRKQRVCLASVKELRSW